MSSHSPYVVDASANFPAHRQESFAAPRRKATQQ